MLHRKFVYGALTRKVTYKLTNRQKNYCLTHWGRDCGVLPGRMVGAAVVRTEALRGGGCCRSPETVREQAVCFLVGGNRLRRDGGLLFRGEAGSGRSFRGAVVAAVPRKRSGNRRCVSWSKGTGCGGAASLFFGERRVRTRFPSPPLFAAIARCLRFRSSPPASPLPVIISSSAVACTPAASHPPHQLPATPPPVSPPPATSATAACHPCRCLPPRCLSLFPACYHPPPAARYLRRCLRPRFCLPSRRFSPAAPAACLLPPSPACHHPLLPAPPPLLTRRYRPPQQLPATPATLRNLPPPAACHFRRHAPAGRTDGLRRHPAWSVGARCVAGEKFCEIIWKIGKSFLSLFRLSIGVLAFRGRDSCFLLDYHSYGKRDYLSDGGRVQEAQGRA